VANSRSGEGSVLEGLEISCHANTQEAVQQRSSKGLKSQFGRGPQCPKMRNFNLIREKVYNELKHIKCV
jgi:hypothetical protein